MQMKTTISLIALISIGHSAIAAPKQLTIATGSAGWEYNRTGEQICSKLNASDRFQCKVLITHGSIQNVDLLKEGKVNLALSQSDIIPNQSTDFISLKALYPQELYIFVREDSKIYSIHELMYKRFNTGPIGSGLRGTMNKVLTATGIVPSDASEVMAAREANILCRNQTDAISFILAPDAPQVAQIKKTCRMRRLGLSSKYMEEVLRQNTTYYPIKLGDSDGKEDAYAVGLYVDLITYKDALPPEDHQLIIDSLEKTP